MQNLTFRLVVLCLGVTVAFSVAGFGQSSTTGVLKGKIVDSYEHARISRALVLVGGRVNGNRKIESDNQGRFAIELPAGTYDVFVSAKGFDPACRKIEVQPGKASVYNVQLSASKIGMED